MCRVRQFSLFPAKFCRLYSTHILCVYDKKKFLPFFFLNAEKCVNWDEKCRVCVCVWSIFNIINIESSARIKFIFYFFHLFFFFYGMYLFTVWLLLLSLLPMLFIVWIWSVNFSSILLFLFFFRLCTEANCFLLCVVIMAPTHLSMYVLITIFDYVTQETISNPLLFSECPTSILIRWIILFCFCSA